MRNKIKLPNPILVGCITLLLIGLPGVLSRVANGQPPTPQAIPWGLWICAYTFFSGISAGSFAVAALAYVFDYRRFRPLVPFALLVSLVALITAVVFVLADLGHPERAFHIALRPNQRSVMAWVIGLYNVFGIAVVSMLVMVLRPQWAKRADETGNRLYRLLALGYRGVPGQELGDSVVLKLIGILGLTSALGLGGGVGALFSALGSRALWHSGLFPVTFIISAMLSGLSAVLAGASLTGNGGHAFKGTLLILGRLIGYLLAIEMVIMPAEGLIVASGAIPSHLTVLKAIAAGPYPWVFWGVQIGLGTVAAMLLLFLPKRATLAATSVAALLVLAGVFAFRLNFVIPQLAMGDFAMSDGLAFYVPDVEEWQLVVFGCGFAGLLVLVGRYVLPVFSTSAPLDFELAARGDTRRWAGLLQHQEQWR